jgi:hypothetical protein
MVSSACFHFVYTVRRTHNNEIHVSKRAFLEQMTDIQLIQKLFYGPRRLIIDSVQVSENTFILIPIFMLLNKKFFKQHFYVCVCVCVCPRIHLIPFVGFEVLTAVSTKMAVAECSLVKFTNVSEDLVATIIRANSTPCCWRQKRSSERLVNFYQTTRRCNSEDSHLHPFWFRRSDNIWRTVKNCDAAHDVTSPFRRY